MIEKDEQQFSSQSGQGVIKNLKKKRNKKETWNLYIKSDVSSKGPQMSAVIYKATPQVSLFDAPNDK